MCRYIALTCFAGRNRGTSVSKLLRVPQIYSQVIGLPHVSATKKRAEKMISRWQNRFTLNLVFPRSTALCCMKETLCSHREGDKSNRHWWELPFYPCHSFPALSRQSHHADAKETLLTEARLRTNLLKAALLCSKMALVSKFCTADSSHPPPQQLWGPAVSSGVISYGAGLWRSWWMPGGWKHTAGGCVHSHCSQNTHGYHF